MKNIAFQVILNTNCDCKSKLLRSMQTLRLGPPGEPFPWKSIYGLWGNTWEKVSGHTFSKKAKLIFFGDTVPNLCTFPLFIVSKKLGYPLKYKILRVPPKRLSLH